MSGAIERCIEHCSEGGVDGERWSRDKAAARAELAAKDAEIEQLREALGEIDRVWEEDLTGEIPYIVTNALSSLPPSDMRLVPVEVLKKIDLVAREAICGAASGNLLLEVVAKALGTHPNCAPSNMAVVLVERLRGIEWASGYERGDCPVCEETKAHGHAPDCWLGNALKGDT